MRRIIAGRHDDQSFKQQLNELTERVFGFTFTRWDALGLWDDRYRAYAVEEAGRLLANVSVARMDLLIGGRRQPAVQIGAVATLPEMRGQGLSRLLMEHVLHEYAAAPAFLFAHEGVLGFYPRFGFKQMTEVQPFIQLAAPLRGASCETLAVNSPLLRQRLEARQRFSAILDVAEAAWINLFHLVMEFGNATYYLPEHDTIVIAKQKGDTVLIYDLLCSPESSLEHLIPDLPFPGATRLEFAFMPDGLGVSYQQGQFVRGDDWGYLFGRGIDFGADSKFPYMCVT